jgi:hypothetical protein
VVTAPMLCLVQVLQHTLSYHALARVRSRLHTVEYEN